MTDQAVTMEPRAKENHLIKGYGEEPSFNNWLTFKSHFNLVERANIMNNVPTWKDSEYKAIQIRLQLDGEVEQWLTISENAGERWMQRSDELMAKLTARYETSEGLEVKIRSFEEAAQLEGESLENFLTRLRKNASYAFPAENTDSVRGRVIWKFLSGLRNDFIRQELFRKKWMGDDNRAKTYDEILSNAQSSEHLYKATTNSNLNTAAVALTTSSYSTDKYVEKSSSIDHLCQRIDNLLAVQRETSRNCPSTGSHEKSSTI